MRYFRHLTLSAALTVFGALSPAAFAAEPPSQVVELFTSQGCSSCPPTNALLNDWSARDDILALTYSVEYWDYLGWKDTFADPKFTARQRAYSKALGHGRVYTPQLVVNGKMDKFKYSRAQIDDVVLPSTAPSITFTDDSVSFTGGQEAPAGAVRLVTYTPGMQSVKVKRGENGGRKLTLTNVVTDVTDLGVWDAKDSTFALPQAEVGKAYAVLLQAGEYGPVTAAGVRE